MNDQANRLREIVNKVNNDNIICPIETLKTSAKVITVTSGKGGVGKTNITVNLGITLSKLGYRVVIIDADLGLANIDVVFGTMPRYTSRKAITAARAARPIAPLWWATPWVTPSRTPPVPPSTS